jgi:hypothetical protein
MATKTKTPSKAKPKTKTEPSGAKGQRESIAKELKKQMPIRTLDYSEAIGDIICERVAHGESVRHICREQDMPGLSTVFKWLNLVPSFMEQYRMALEIRAESLADELVEIADEGETKVVLGSDGTTCVVFDSTAVARNRLRVDTRKWVASKLKPKKYGDKTTTELTGADGGAVKFEGVTDKDLDARIAALSKKLGEVK